MALKIFPVAVQMQKKNVLMTMERPQRKIIEIDKLQQQIVQKVEIYMKPVNIIISGSLSKVFGSAYHFGNGITIL